MLLVMSAEAVRVTRYWLRASARTGSISWLKRWWSIGSTACRAYNASSDSIT
jgi:hypothetical protein